MEVIQPEQASLFLNTVYLSALKNEHRITKQIIEAIPLDKGDYRPDSISKTALELAWHIVAAEHRFLEGIASGKFDFTPNHRSESIRDSAAIASWYGKTFEGDFARVSSLSGVQLTKIIDFRGLFQLPAVAYIQFSLFHSIHHRGQLSMYLRPMGAKVPSIYGESYDASEARKAQATAS
jgi:uncharacterized damage-inducible protein DinB